MQGGVIEELGRQYGHRALFSPCRRYRYRLDRILWEMGFGVRHNTLALVIMVNPSTADADEDDQTLKKVQGLISRVKTIGLGRIAVCNLFAWRATDVTELGKAEDPIGPENDRIILEAMDEADIVIVAWGARSKFPKGYSGRVDEIMTMAKRAGKPLHYWGVTGAGDPRHPLMIAYDTPLLKMEDKAA